MHSYTHSLLIHYMFNAGNREALVARRIAAVERTQALAAEVKATEGSCFVHMIHGEMEETYRIDAYMIHEEIEEGSTGAALC